MDAGSLGYLVHHVHSYCICMSTTCTYALTLKCRMGVSANGRAHRRFCFLPLQNFPCLLVCMMSTPPNKTNELDRTHQDPNTTSRIVSQITPMSAIMMAPSADMPIRGYLPLSMGRAATQWSYDITARAGTSDTRQALAQDMLCSFFEKRSCEYSHVEE